MPRARLVVLPAAARDYEEAFAWYYNRSRTMAVQFQREIARTLRLIAESPKRWPLRRGFRRMLVRKFPYSIIYRVFKHDVLVIAVAHGRRRPFYWLRRDTE